MHEFTNENYINAQDLYDAAIHEFEKIREPQLSVTIDIVNFLEILEEQRNWDKLVLGDIVTVYYPDLNINIKAKITEIDYDFEGSQIKLTISNVEKILDDKEKFLQDIHKSISTSTNVNMNSYKWNGVDTVKSDVNNLIDVLQKGVKSSIDLAINEDVSISSRGLIIKDPTDPMSYLVANHGVLAITNDNSASWKNAITKDGIVKEKVKFITIKL
jgi:hypothetical protein